MKKDQKARIVIMVVCASLIIIFTYIWGLPWWFIPLWLSPGPLTILFAIIFKKITGKNLRYELKDKGW